MTSDSMMKTFVYCRITDGGMEAHFVHSANELQHLYGWMSADCKSDDEELVAGMEKAEVGDLVNHRLGLAVRLKDVPLDNGDYYAD